MCGLRILPAVAMAIALGHAGTAAANGRFPATTTVKTRPGNATDIYLGTTFGLLLSTDDGGHFYWVCEDAIGYSGTFDPKYRIAADGTIYATTFEGLRVSRDHGCTFELVTEALPQADPGRIAGLWVDTIDLASDGTVWIGTAESGLPNNVYRSTDAGVSFSPVGLGSAEIWWKSLRVAPSAASRVYVSGYQVTQVGPDGGTIAPQVHLRRSNDTGASWEPLPLTGIDLAPSPLLLIEAVGRDNPDLVFVRSVGAMAPGGDKLYRSSDGGMTWGEVLVSATPITALTIRSSGEVLVGTGSGAYHSTDGGTTFPALTGAPSMACVDERGDQTVLACGSNWEPDFAALGRSSDLATWNKVVRFVEIAGPLSCPAGTVQRDTCEARIWPSLRQQFGIPGGEPTIDENSGAPSGCCSGAAASGASLVLVALVALLLRRRRA